MISLLTMVFAGCSEDYSTSVSPQSTPQESALQSSAITFTPVNISGINLSNLIKDDNPIELGSVAVDGSLPANTIMGAKVDIARNSDYSDALTLKGESMASSNIVSVRPSDLQAAYYNNYTHNPNQTKLYMRIRLVTITDGTSEAIVGTPGSNFFGNYDLLFTPVDEKGIYISTGYYAVVKGLDGNWTETKFKHSDIDVYDDPVFTGSIEAIKDENNVRKDTEFYIVAEEDLTAFKNGDKSVAFGKGEGEGMLKGGPAFVGPANDGAAKYNLSMNMEKQAIAIEPEVHLYYYYLFGTNELKPSEGEEYKNYLFYKSGNTEFTYTTNWKNNASLKVWEHEGYNKTTEAWGVKSMAHKESGDLVKGAIWNIGNVGWYTLTITMDEDKNIHTYKWTAIEAPTTEYTNISIIGTVNGSNWDKDFDLTQCKSAPHNWYLMNFELTADAELKFRAEHAWGKDWGGDGSQPISNVVYSLPTGDKNIIVPAGKYDIYFNDITGQWTILKVQE